MKKVFTTSLLLILLGIWASSVPASVLYERGSSLSDITRSPGRTPAGLPPVNLDHLSDDAYEAGKIQIWFHPQMSKSLEQGLIMAKSGEAVKLGVAGLDELNQRFGIRRYQPLLHELYQRADKSSLSTERHQQWGLHLWYELSLDAGVDVIEAVRSFAQLPSVAIAEPVYRKIRIEPEAVFPMESNDATQKWAPADQYYGLQWGFKNTGQDIRGTFGTPGADISAEAAWDRIKGNPVVIVAIIDGGIQYNHPDLQANIWPGIGPDGTNTVPDDHGTHVAGTIAAASNNSIGVAGTAGGDGSSNSGVKLMSIDLFNGSHGLNTLGMNVYAADNGAAVSQNSWGYSRAGVYNSSDLQGIDYFNANGGGNVLQGGLTIFAAGNDNNDGQWYPACYSGAMAVAATDNKDLKSSFSNYGSWIDLSAPGTDIASTASGSSYVWMSGTSMACPHVSGVAALVLSYAPGVMSNQQLWDLLVATTDNIDALNPSFAGKLGSGRLNASKAIEAAEAYLGGGVSKPLSFNAAAVNESEISLQWQPNNQGDPVLLAWSANGTFGSPQDGVTYSPGQSIPGGGTVLYTGSNLSAYMHSGLDPATKYYYRSWSYNSEAYSGYLQASATTLCPTQISLPYAEDFNNTGNDIPLCWTSEGTFQWTVGTFANGLSSSTGNYAYAQISGNTAQNAQLISPAFDFSGISNVRLSFKHRYNHSRSSANLAYSLNDGVNWTTLQSWTSNTGNAVFDQVIPDLAGQPSVMFRWEFVFSGGGAPTIQKSWSIDDVAVMGQSAGITYTITATAGTGGTINPSGTVSVNEHEDKTFSITPGTGYAIEDVLVDGSSVGAVSSYTFFNVTANHNIAASFEPLPVVTYTIAATAGSGGSISPSGNITVNEHADQSFTIAPAAGFVVDAVLVDGSSVGAVNSYTFYNVTANHSIEASFATAPDDPCLIAALPYVQDFNASTSLPDCWDAEIVSGNTPWLFGGFSGGLSGTTGNYAYFHYQGNKTQQAELLSPPFDFSMYEGINLQFRHSYVHNLSNAQLLYSTDMGGSWTLIQGWSASTANPAVFNATIAALAGKSHVIFKWSFSFSGGGSVRNVRSWSVDDVQLSGTHKTQAGISAFDINSLEASDISSLEMTAYPNPVSSRMNLSFNKDIEQGSLAVIDIQGRQLMQMDVYQLAAGSSFGIDISTLPKGIYLLRFITGKTVSRAVIAKE